MTLDLAEAETGKDPLYRKIFSTLRGEILAGSFEHDHALPSDKQLEARFGVSRITIRRALDELARGGLVDRAKGKATRINERRTTIFADVDDELANMLAAISNLATRVINFRWSPADAFMAGQMKVEKGEKLLWITRVRSRGAAPVMHSSLHLPRWAGEGLTREDLAVSPIVDLLRRRGVELASAEQTMTAAPCPAILAPRLSLQPGAPIFLIRRIIFDDRQLPVMFNDASFRWDSFTYHMSLEPTRSKWFDNMTIRSGSSSKT